MASKRLLKKDVNNITYMLVSECFTYRHFHPEANSGINDIIQDIVLARNGLIKKINQAPSDPKETAPYYKIIGKEMQDMVDIMDRIESIK